MRANEQRERNLEIYRKVRDGRTLQEVGNLYPVNGKPLSRQRVSIICKSVEAKGE